MASVHSNVFFDFTINGAPAGRVIFDLFDDTVPIASRNFRELATGQHGFGYAGSRIHRVIAGFAVQGGDITNGDGTGGRSIYGRPFLDETYRHPHDRPGLLSMANFGPSTNTSQFFITTAPGPHCDKKNVVFGEVVSGLNVVQHIQSFHTSDPRRQPSANIIIERCGVVAP